MESLCNEISSMNVDSTVDSTLSLGLNNLNLEDKDKPIYQLSKLSEKPFFNFPRSNGLKFQPICTELDGTVCCLSPDPGDEVSSCRWKIVVYRPRIFKIAKMASSFTYINRLKGRPPTNYEEYCPNCYEILPIVYNYKNCPGCCQKILAINEDLRRKVLLGKISM